MNVPLVVYVWDVDRPMPVEPSPKAHSDFTTAPPTSWDDEASNSITQGEVLCDRVQVKLATGGVLRRKHPVASARVADSSAIAPKARLDIVDVIVLYSTDSMPLSANGGPVRLRQSLVDPAPHTSIGENEATG